MVYTLAVLAVIGFAQYYKNQGKLEAFAQMPVVSPLADEDFQLEEKTFEDTRVQKLYDFLRQKESPLSSHAQLIVDLSDEHDLPYTLIVAIAGKESSFGHAIKEGSHNAWGVMGWDANGKRHIRNFSSWEEGIRFEARLLDENYRDKMARGIQETYCPSFECSDTWVSTVAGFQEEINE